MKCAPRILPLILLASVIGCVRYHAKPLTQQSVNQALEPPQLEELQVNARSLSHPILKPLEINLADGLSPEEAGVIAVLANPALRAERDRRNLAEAQLIQAKLLPNPVLSSSLDLPTGGATDGAVNAYGVGIAWDIRDLISHSARVKASKAERAEVDLSVAWSEWQVAEGAKMIVYRLLALQKKIFLATEIDGRLQEILDLARRALAGGINTQVDMVAAETAAAESRAALSDLKKQEREERQRLNQLMGFPPQTEIPLQQDVELPAQWNPPTLEQIMTGLEERRLDLVALKKGYDSSEQSLRAAVLEQFPRINIGLNRARDTGNVITTGFAISIDLPIFDRNQGAIAIEKATRQALYDEYTSRVFQARSDIAMLVANIGSVNEQIVTAQGAEDALARLEQAYHAAIGKSLGDIVNYYTIWNNLSKERIDKLTLMQELAESRVALEVASGLYRVDSGQGAE